MSVLSGWPFPSHVAAGFPVALKLVSVLLLSAMQDEKCEGKVHSGLKIQAAVALSPKLGIRSSRKELFSAIHIFLFNTEILFGSVYTKGQHPCSVNAAMTLVIQLSLKTMQSLENCSRMGLQPISERLSSFQ